MTVRGQTWYLHVLPDREAPLQLRDVPRPASVTALRTGQALPHAFYGGTLMVDVSGPWRTPLDDVVAVHWG